MEQLLQLLLEYAKLIETDEFDYQFTWKNDECIDDQYNLRGIEIYYRDSTGKIEDHFSFDSEKKAIDGMQGLIQFKQNAA